MDRYPAGWMAFGEWLGIPPSQARMLAALYSQPGPLKAHELSLACGVTEGAVRWHVCRLRSALNSEALDCDRGRGYRLTEVGRSECRAVIASMAWELGLVAE
jgi:predicted ArsR family transcriptional regulator